MNIYYVINNNNNTHHSIYYYIHIQNKFNYLQIVFSTHLLRCKVKHQSIDVQMLTYEYHQTECNVYSRMETNTVYPLVLF